MNTVTVIGGGPIGLNTAAKLADEGWKVQVLEEHPEIGFPVHCSGLISASGVKELKLDVKDVIVNKIYGFKIFSPSGKELVVKRKAPVAFKVSRPDFDKMFYEKALKAGADIKMNSKLMGIRGETLFYQKDFHGEIVKSKIIVGADGVQSKVRGQMGISLLKKNFVHAYQEIVQGRFEKKFAYVFLGDFAKNYFAWLIPHSDTKAELGLAVPQGKNPADSFKDFVQKQGLKFETIEKDSSLIPCGQPLKETVKDNMVLVGDAAFQTKATSGGGLMLGLMASNICAETITKHLKKTGKLTDYYKNCSPVNKELIMHWKIRQQFNSMSNKEIDKLFDTLIKSGMNEFLSEYGDMDKPSKFIPKILTTPRLWRLMPMALKLVM